MGAPPGTRGTNPPITPKKVPKIPPPQGPPPLAVQVGSSNFAAPGEGRSIYFPFYLDMGGPPCGSDWLFRKFYCAVGFHGIRKIRCHDASVGDVCAMVAVRNYCVRLFSSRHVEFCVCESERWRARGCWLPDELVQIKWS